MADSVRSSQDAIEVAFDLFIEARNSQHVIEVAYPLPINARRSQEVVELAVDEPINNRITQNIIEIIPTPPDVSGVYFINPSKVDRRDTYYGDRAVPNSPQVQKKIPDPTIRTALLGE